MIVSLPLPAQMKFAGAAAGENIVSSGAEHHVDPSAAGEGGPRMGHDATQTLESHQRPGGIDVRVCVRVVRLELHRGVLSTRTRPLPLIPPGKEILPRIILAIDDPLDAASGCDFARRRPPRCYSKAARYRRRRLAKATRRPSSLMPSTSLPQQL